MLPRLSNDCNCMHFIDCVIVVSAGVDPGLKQATEYHSASTVHQFTGELLRICEWNCANDTSVACSVCYLAQLDAFCLQLHYFSNMTMSC